MTFHIYLYITLYHNIKRLQFNAFFCRYKVLIFDCKHVRHILTSAPMFLYVFQSKMRQLLQRQLLQVKLIQHPVATSTLDGSRMLDRRAIYKLIKKFTCRLVKHSLCRLCFPSSSDGETNYRDEQLALLLASSSWWQTIIGPDRRTAWRTRAGCCSCRSRRRVCTWLGCFGVGAATTEPEAFPASPSGALSALVARRIPLWSPATKKESRERNFHYQGVSCLNGGVIFIWCGGKNITLITVGLLDLRQNKF